ncbi:HlyU family transcriptional regulator [Devosia sp. YIM 151766]|uniref:HlyU family transcriptional regulator n=1 Tax=Devosia sp. YIM 151766 TaxID=3017325 RepID=UPI00255CE08C|nr:HlyU family transcriptional regulator [Devosia sp. YIM 151766]WIY51794.1 HlyU family transcriptional regulator [Devosia sp. YIM 151766]
MSFLKKLFGGGSASAEPQGDKVLGEDNHKGFLIKAIEMKAGSELQLAGTIEKEIGGELKTYRFIRADRMSSADDLVTLALSKGRQIVDEQGEQIFR